MHKLATAVLLALLLARSAYADGKHVILLIDDSKDMRGWRDALEARLPGWLFRGPDPSDPATPRFDPASDTLSVAYFSLRNEGPSDDCKRARGDVISPDTLLQIEKVDAADEESFRRGLRESLNRPCRFDGHLSPIITSPILALPYLQQHLPPDALFSRVFIAMATNDEFNFKASSPAAEMSYLVKTFPELNVQAPADTLNLVESVTSRFNFDTNMRWHDDRIGLRYRVIEAVARSRAPEAAMVFNRRLQIDRVAADSNSVFGTPKIPGAGDIRIPASELTPLTLEWKLSDNGGITGALDLTQCQQPACSAGDDGMRIDLFHPELNPLKQSSADGALSPNTLSFRVWFRLNTGGIYDHLLMQSAWQQMELMPVPPVSAWLLAYPLLLDNSLLTKLWSGGDGAPPSGGLTHDEGVTRLSRLNFAAWCATILLLILVIARAARRSRVYTFIPDIEWAPAGEVILDFDRPGHSRVLVGSLVVRNRGKVGWLGRHLGGVEQPTRNAAVSLDADVAEVLTKAGFQLTDGVSIGFFDEHSVLTDAVKDAVSEGRQIHVFLAEDAISDFLADGEIKEQPVQLRVPAKLEFAANDVVDAQYATIRTEIKIEVRVKPETPRTPSVVYESAPHRELYYGHHAHLAIGRFLFHSEAKHRFAQPFQKSYALSAACERRPLAGAPLRLVPDSITLDAHRDTQVAVELWCDEAEVRNPDPVSHNYAFVLHGEHTAAYRADDLTFDLRRDPTKSEIELHFVYHSRRVEVHWDAKRKAWACRPEAGLDVTVDGATMRFKKPSHYAFEAQEATRIALGIEVGNSAKSGKGAVGVRVNGKLALAADVAGMLHMRPEWEPNDILDVPPHPLVVREGEAPIFADVYLRSTPIASIDGGEIAPEKCSVQIALAVEVTTDTGELEKRPLSVQFPLHLEQLPGANVVVIDFGTSSIAAAVGTAGERNDNPLLDLQHVKVYQNESVATVDPHGPEVGTPFLPSAIVCDADERQKIDMYGRNLPPGFPRHTGINGASLVPSAPSFITLPARRQDFDERPGRVLLSLKTWLGMNAQHVPLPAGNVRFLDGTKMRNEPALPLDDLLEASYAALAQAYLKPHGRLGAGQVVICHPNTFSELHRERLRRIAWNALAGPLEIISPKHLHLMSESDAVAYAYCWDRMRETAPKGIERVLVYDLGAGTLDLSVITIEWNADPIYPTFRSRHHLGVPVAGNYFDETLARIVHDLLSDAEVLGTEKLKYVHPVVTREKHTNDHPSASRAFWAAIRSAKQQWGDDKDFEVLVGKVGRGHGLLSYFAGMPGPDVPSKVHGRAGVALRDSPDGQLLVLTVPGAQIHSHPRIDRLVEFLTRDVVREMLGVAGVCAEEIDTLIVSGRGALWPGLKKAVERELPNARSSSFTSSERMKAAVARGAIAWRYFIRENAIESDNGIRGRLAVVYGHDASTCAVFEDQWDRPIRIPVARFRIVDVGLSKPDPARDLGNGSLRKHFYVGVGRHEYATQQVGGSLLRFRKVGGGEIVITNEDGDQYRIGRRDTVHHAAAAWPIGHPFLSPDEEQA
ncbi:MAG TPA: hypothetical protein VF618_12435 [Thermoanaerobaculia bacterium]